MSLWQHQIEGVERIKADDGVHALLWQPGAGKSATVVRYLEELAAELGRPVRALIVVPKSVLGVWPGEFAKHCNLGWTLRTLDGSLNSRFAELPEHGTEWAHIGVTLMAYSSFSSKPHGKLALAMVKAANLDVIVLDEAHAIRGAQSNTSKLLGKVGQLVPRRLLLTGTPTPHGPEDVYGLWRFLHPEAFAGPDKKMVSYTRWLQGYATFGGYQGRQIVEWRDLDDMQERMARKSSVVLTEDCHDLPPLVIQQHAFSLSVAEQKCYDEMRRDLLTVVEDDTITAQNKLVAVLRLRQVTSGFLPNEEGDVRQIGTSRRDLAMELLEDLLASEKRIVVFAWSRHEVESVFEQLCALDPWGATTVKIDGGTPISARERYLAWFADNSSERRVLVAQIDTLNSGTNALVGASHALYLSMTNRGEVFQQSLARLHRPGQTASKVTAHVLQAMDSIDESMLDVLQGRADAERVLLDHIRGVK